MFIHSQIAEDCFCTRTLVFVAGTVQYVKLKVFNALVSTENKLLMNILIYNIAGHQILDKTHAYLE